MCTMSMAIPTIAPENKFNLTIEEACGIFSIGNTLCENSSVAIQMQSIFYILARKLLSSDLSSSSTFSKRVQSTIERG